MSYVKFKLQEIDKNYGVNKKGFVDSELTDDRSS